MRSGHWIFPTTRWAIYLRDGMACVYCRRGIHELIDSGDPDAFLVIDHVVPVKRNGGNEPGNLVTSCYACNNAKGLLTVAAFARKTGECRKALHKRIRRRVTRDIEVFRPVAAVLLDGVPGVILGRAMIVNAHDFKARARWSSAMQDEWEHLAPQASLFCHACGRGPG